MLTAVVSAMVLLGLLALGDFLANISRARIPSLFVVALLFLLLTWTGILPDTIIKDSTMTTIAPLLVALLITHMGTLIPIKSIKSQWKAVVTALIGIIFAVILVLAIVTPIYGFSIAASGIGPLTGGIIAFVITSDTLKAQGMESLIVIPAMVLAMQKIVGLPLASQFLQRYAVQFIQRIRKRDPEVAAASESNLGNDESETEKTPHQEDERQGLIPKKYATPATYLFLLSIGGAIAVYLGNLTGIHYSIWALIAGLIGTWFGVYESAIMQKANSFGISMSILILYIIASLGDVSPQELWNDLPTILLILVVGSIGIILGGMLAAKLFRLPALKFIPVALTALFGFPADYLLSEEVSRTVSNDETEQKQVFDDILPPMLIGGFTTVTIASVLVAGIIMSFI
ncbi:hypothetical protein [Tuberibacillus sp. Marseille-P3662]|uniref:hypothetical protein n=1 Tax=Tuberibacillus sp. Marseille-P3662 TaxID=1965358 RepID=UPI000A1CD658|nr:hypothetical protein [Tuberibacillus sp. Marseille-P3662]